MRGWHPASTQEASIRPNRGVAGAGGRELNPVLAALMRLLGPGPALILAKLGVAAGVAVLWHLQATGVLAALAAVYALIVMHNWRQRRS